MNQTLLGRIVLLFLVVALLVPSFASAQRLWNDLDALFDGLGSGVTVGAMVTDETGKVIYYERNKDQGLFPASNQKLVTTVAAMDILGEDHSFESRVYYDGTFSGGVLSGHVNLLVEHDVTWNLRCLANPREGLDAIAAALAADGLTQITGNVRVYGASFYNNGTTGNIRTTGPGYQNGTVAGHFRDALINVGVTVGGTSSGQTGFNPPGDLVYIHRSTDLLYRNPDTTHNNLREMPLDLAAASIGINRPSDNPMADALLMHIGYKVSGVSTLAAGGEVVLQWLKDDVQTNYRQMVISDGSGLAPALAPSLPGNRATAASMIDVVRYGVNNLRGFDTSLPINGRSPGTIGSRMTDLPRVVHAKTGSLGSTITLSGYIDHPIYGERIYFSFLANANSGSIDQPAARNAIDNAVRELAGAFHPMVPTMMSARNDGTGDTITVSALNHRSGVDSFRFGYSTDIASATSNTAIVPPAAPYIIESHTSGQNFADYSEPTGTWQNSTATSAALGTTASTTRWALPTTPSTARFTPSALSTGRYRIDATTYGSNFISDNAHAITVRIADANGTRERLYDFSFETTGDVWAPLGYVDFVAGAGHFIEIDNSTQVNVGTSGNTRLVAAAVRYVPIEVEHTFTGLAPGQTHYFDVFTRRGSTDSPRSSLYAARPAAIASPLLLVDGNERWRNQAPNPQSRGHNFAARIGQAVSQRPFDTLNNNAMLLGTGDLNDYAAVGYILGEESTNDQTFNYTEQELVAEFRAAGGNFFYSGSEIGWDLDQLGSSRDRGFFRNELRQGYVRDDAGGTTATGLAGDILAAATSIDFSGGPLGMNWPDEMSTANGSVAIAEYTGTGSGVAALRYDDNGSASGRIVGFGFAVEMVADVASRTAIMDGVLGYLLPESRVDSWIILE